MLFIGSTVLIFCWDGWVRACDIGLTRLAWLVHIWDIVIPYGAYALTRRALVEDEQLRRRFGRDWEVYKRNVPFSYIPYVI